jgi:hypothetical protein
MLSGSPAQNETMRSRFSGSFTWWYRNRVAAKRELRPTSGRLTQCVSAGVLRAVGVETAGNLGQGRPGSAWYDQRLHGCAEYARQIVQGRLLADHHAAAQHAFIKGNVFEVFQQVGLASAEIAATRTPDVGRPRSAPERRTGALDCGRRPRPRYGSRAPGSSRIPRRLSWSWSWSWSWRPGPPRNSVDLVGRDGRPQTPFARAIDQDAPLRRQDADQ